MVSGESEKRKQQKVVVFCCNCYVGQGAFMSVSDTYVFQGSTYPYVMKMDITNQVSAMEV